MTSLSDLFAAQFPQPSAELLARLAALDLLLERFNSLSDSVGGLANDVGFLETTADRLTEMIDTMADNVSALTAVVAALNAQINPPKPDPYPNDTVHIAPALLRTSKTNLIWTAVQETEHTAATRAIMDRCSHGKNHHWIGFGANLPIQTSEGGPYDWTYLDSIFGYPNRSDGWFGDKGLRVLTVCGSPPYMRVPKAGTAPMPYGTPPSGLYDYFPPHWSHHDNWAKLVAAAVDRYQIDAVHEWNEYKGESIGSTLAAGSVLVPPGSGLPQYAGSTTNRWAMEMHCDRANKVWTRVKAIRPQCKIMRPYMVQRTYLDPANSDSMDGTFPKDLHGAWGNGDWKAMQAVMYEIENSNGMDGVCLDVKTSTQEGGITAANQWSGLQKIPDVIAWLRKLAVYDPAKYGRPQANAATMDVWFAEAYSRLPSGLNVNNHAEAVATDAWAYTKYVLPYDVAGWCRWQVEGNRGAADSADAHSIALWHAKGSPNSLKETEAVPMYAGMVEHFPPGTPLYSVAADDIAMTGIASDTTICLVSRSGDPVKVTVKGEPLVLAPYDVKFVAR